MKTVTIPGLNADVGQLGMGCASLGSRVSAARGRAALDAAFDAGITWYDLAPAYGAGQAEVIFADFAAPRRDAVQICTKVGLLPPPQPLWKRAILPIARPIVGALKPLRARIKRTGMTSNRAVTLTPEMLRTSLDQSLSRLKTDYVDVYALHNVTPQALADEALLRALQDILTSGKARAIATAAGHDAARAGIATGAPVGLVQCAHPGLPDDLLPQAQAAGIGVITHSVFGVDGPLTRLTARMKSDPALTADLAVLGHDSAASALLAQALQTNAQGVVLCSMMSPASLSANLAASTRTAPVQPLLRKAGFA